MKDITYTPDYPDNSGWKRRHVAMVTALRRSSLIRYTNGHMVVMAIDAWCNYARLHQERYESGIGADYVLGPAWARWGFALRELLNGEMRPADCGTLDTILCDNLAEQDFNPDDGAP
jgi:hypothetical protein